jgi:hypothetical protein
MSTTFTWSISDLERRAADGIVYTVHYRVDAADGTYTSGAYGSIGLEAPEEGDEVVPFADLTPELVVSWVQAALGAEKVEQVSTALQTQIDEQHAPSTAKGTPW